MSIRGKTAGVIALATFFAASGAAAQDPMTVMKGGHRLGETATQFFAEGYENGVLSACAAGNYKGANRASKRQLKKYCGDLQEARDEAVSGKRYEFTGGGDLTEMRRDTFTFDAGHLVKAELVYSTPNAEVNYRGQSFEKLFAGVKQAYGPPTSESTKIVHDAYGVEYVAHHEVWLGREAVIAIDEQPGPEGATSLDSFTRGEYDRTMGAGATKAANPLQ